MTLRFLFCSILLMTTSPLRGYVGHLDLNSRAKPCSAQEGKLLTIHRFERPGKKWGMQCKKTCFSMVTCMVVPPLALQGRSLCPILVHMKLMKSQHNIFHTSYCVLATATYTLLVKYWLRLLQGEEWGGEGVPFTCLIYMSNIKTEMKHVADCLQSFMSGVEVSGPAHKSHCSFVAVATDLCDL